MFYDEEFSLNNSNLKSFTPKNSSLDLNKWVKILVQLKQYINLLRRSFNYSIKITEFYFLKNAKELKKRIEKETSLKNVNIFSINDTKHQVLLGPYSNINTLQSKSC